MRAFHCNVCGSLAFFENVRCLKCGHAFGFLPDRIDLGTLEPRGNGCWAAVVPGTISREYRLCGNGVEHQACNWMVAAEEGEAYCAACRLNLVIPDLSVPGHLDSWRQVESAKRRMMYTVLRLKLPTEGGGGRPPLRFRIMSSKAGELSVMTGHAAGVITINLAEADPAERERRRVSLHEPFRTLLGHLRHETAHYYWDELVRDREALSGFRALFGDERADYAAALRHYYAGGSPPDWQARHISAYAAAHPWEDWAETSAHYFHMVDTVETAASFGLALRPRHPDARSMTADPAAAGEAGSSFDRLLENWFPMTYALNELNRGMGLPDLYPFVLSSVGVEKMRFVHDCVRAAGGR